jgi:hypothetical protein
MANHIITTNTIDWNKVLRVTLRVNWWLLKAIFKVLIVLGTAAVTLFVALFLSDDKSDTDHDEEQTEARIPNNGFAREAPALKYAPRSGDTI